MPTLGSVACFPFGDAGLGVPTLGDATFHFSAQIWWCDRYLAACSGYPTLCR